MKIPLPDLITGAVPWDELRERFAWVRDMHETPQDPIHHAEGDVGTHSRMVCEALVGLSEYKSLTPDEQEEVYLAAVLHDIAKPLTMTPGENGRISNPGHSPKGAIMARRVMWELGYPFDVRERVCGMILFHQVPYFILSDKASLRRLVRMSMYCRMDLLAMLTKADILGRICEDPERLLENIELFRMYAEEHGVLDQSWPFEHEYDCVRYFEGQAERPTHIYDDTEFVVYVMSGMPGAGKDTWIKAHYPDMPCIGMDSIRAQMGVEYGDTKGMGQAQQALKEQAKVFLRAKQSFIWNGTHLTRDMRSKTIQLCRDYNAKVEIIYIEAEHDAYWDQNRNREARVPEKFIEKLLRGWDVPRPPEAHIVGYYPQPWLMG